MYALTITSHDIKEATTKLKKGKASGPDNISPEHLIYIGKATMHLIMLIYNYYLSTAHTSQKMKDGLILPFHKGKGKDPRDPRNYRGITLSSSFSKLLELILKPRLEKTLQGNGIPDELQFGFQKNHSCMLTSCTMEFIIEINTCQKRPTYVALLDAEKAFDKVWHDGLFYKVDQTNIDPAYTALLRSLYENMESRVLWSDKTSGAIPILQGVRQDLMISRGTKTFYALTGAGAYTGGLLPHHCARLWKTYCIPPRMLYGVAIMKLNQTRLNKLDRSQYQLFKKILGLPNSAADDAVYLLTGLFPLSMRVDQEILLVIGQLINLPHSRYEVRTLHHAITNFTPLARTWERTLRSYELPNLHSLLSKPVPYITWKSVTRSAIDSAMQKKVREAINAKSSLAFFKNNTSSPHDLYPKSISSSFLRQAIIVRSQLLSQTYLTQSRLCKIKKGTIRFCQVCKAEEEDITHFIAKCKPLRNHRQKLVDNLHHRGVQQSTLALFSPDDPETFTNHDVLLSINNLRQGLTNVDPLSILECLTDVGTNIGLVVERNGKEILLFAFHLDEEGNRPVVQHIFHHRFETVETLCFPLVGFVIPPESSFEETPVYAYDNSMQVELTLKESGRFMEIDTGKATFIVTKNILTLNRYNNIYQDEGKGTPVVISTSTTTFDSNADSDVDPDIHCDDGKPMCIEGNSDGPLEVLPDYMTNPNAEIPQNNKFFFMNLDLSGGTPIKAANTEKGTASAL
eukprot:XP_011673490.1 PREDICTED: uncharacterized protein LOC105442755 [Strongylocentrotus purpuratus]